MSLWRFIYFRIPSSSCCQHFSKHVIFDNLTLKRRFSNSFMNSCISRNRFFIKKNSITKESLLLQRNQFSTLDELHFSNASLWKYLLHLKKTRSSFTSGVYSNELSEFRYFKHLQSNTVDSIIELIDEYEGHIALIAELGDLMQDQEDKEMIILARNDMDELQSTCNEIEEKVIKMITPQLQIDDRDLFLEVRAGVGGQEAMLFTKDLFEMYLNFVHAKGWTSEIINFEESETGGIRHAQIAVNGINAYKFLKFESGVHRVQRVPKTEKTGRIHTSTTTVAIIPQPHEVDVEILDKDLKIDAFRSSGGGGQHANTTNSAVRVTHLPTGIIVECQKDRSQISNKKTAITILRSRIFDKELADQQQDIRSSRKLQIGSAGRSEKIRTYNFQQDRITDHRIPMNIHGLENFFLGGNNFQNLMNSLEQFSQKELLLELLDSFDEGIR